MATKRIRFTKRSLDALKPKRTRFFVYDETTVGLCVCVSPAGTRTLYRYGRIDGRPVRYRLGVFPETTVQQARTACARVTADVMDGQNPHRQRMSRRDSMTMGELWDDWRENDAKGRKRPKSIKEDGGTWTRYLKSWNGKRLAEVSRQDVKRLHKSVGSNNGKYAANRMLALLSTIFNYAIAEGHMPDNPTKGVKRFREQSRERFLDAGELKQFEDALTEEPAIFQDFWLLAILTGARKINLLSMAWENIRIESAVWYIPLTKSGDSQAVHLPDPAVEILKRRKVERKASPWVFPSPRGNTAAGHLTDVHKSWNRIVGRCVGLDDTRPHDLRRTLGSWMTAAGTSMQIVGKSLGHKSLQATAVYARLDLEPVKAAVDQAISAMQKSAGVRLDGKIEKPDTVPFPSAGDVDGKAANA